MRQRRYPGFRFTTVQWLDGPIRMCTYHKAHGLRMCWQALPEFYSLTALRGIDATLKDAIGSPRPRPT